MAKVYMQSNLVKKYQDEIAYITYEDVDMCYKQGDGTYMMNNGDVLNIRQATDNKEDYDLYKEDRWSLYQYITEQRTKLERIEKVLETMEDRYFAKVQKFEKEGDDANERIWLNGMYTVGEILQMVQDNRYLLQAERMYRGGTKK